MEYYDVNSDRYFMPSLEDTQWNYEHPREIPPLPVDIMYDRYGEHLTYEMSHHAALRAAGGRPTHDPLSGYEILAQPEAQSDIITFWYDIDQRFEVVLEILDIHMRRPCPQQGFNMMYAQYAFWRRFRQYQAEVRSGKYRSSPFESYVDQLRRQRRELGLAGDIHLNEDRERQSPLDDWKELQCYEHERLQNKWRYVERRAGFMSKWRYRLNEAMQQGCDPQRMRELQASAWIAFWCFDWADRECREYAVLVKWIDEQVAQLETESVSGASGHDDDVTPIRGKQDVDVEAITRARVIRLENINSNLEQEMLRLERLRFAS